MGENAPMADSIGSPIRHLASLSMAEATCLVALQRAGYALEAELIDYPQLPPLFETPEQLVASGERFLLWEEEDALRGALGFKREDDLLDIWRLVVDPQSFRRGIGRALVAAAEAYAVRPGRVIVSTAERNEPAVRLYLSAGYSVAERRTLPDGLALVHFEKRLA